ncbi:exonuclease domain-containing protein [Corynebacterium choanae]|uniref:DNA polymerase III PolC-type n=1 Tax=Corynebacterium choanae TaxID=1862358 RepID=A0A3G6JB43_9CORY|nr:exonuclease domain-containing protein [Corynebacterium choanae]AZA14208.1 DNA polymerase III PolC-type [Corynebacterium choanae]
MDTFVSIDFETANECRGSACAVAVVKMTATGTVVDRFSTLLKPHPQVAHFSPRCVRVHGITAPDVQHAPTWEEVHPQIRALLGDDPLVAHNMAFDGYVLTDLDLYYQLESLPNRRFCTLRLARKLFPDLRRHTLPVIYQQYFPAQRFRHHNAAADAEVCAKIFARMVSDEGFARVTALCPPTGPAAQLHRQVETTTQLDGSMDWDVR